MVFNVYHRAFFPGIFEFQVFPKSESSLRRLALSKYNEWDTLLCKGILGTQIFQFCRKTLDSHRVSPQVYYREMIMRVKHVNSWNFAKLMEKVGKMFSGHSRIIALNVVYLLSVFLPCVPECIPKMAIPMFFPSYRTFLQGCMDTLPVRNLCSLLLNLGRPGWRWCCVPYMFIYLKYIVTWRNHELSFMSWYIINTKIFPWC